MRTYSILTNLIWSAERLADWVATKLQHIRVRSQLGDIERENCLTGTK